MPNKKNVIAELEFSDDGCTLQIYLQAVNTKEAIDAVLEKSDFRKSSISIGTIKERPGIRDAGFLRQQQDGL